MLAGQPSRREANIVYVRNAHRWKDNFLAEGKEPNSRRRRLASSKGHFQEFCATARRFPLMSGAGRLWHKVSAVMTFVMAQIMEGLAEYAFAMHPELRCPPSGPGKRDFSERKEPAKNNAGLSHRSVPSKITPFPSPAPARRLCAWGGPSPQ
jgi:hypothetical protein